MSNKRTLLSAHSPRYGDALNKTVFVTAVFAEIENFGEVEFLATPDDIEPHGREILAQALGGQFGQIAAYVPPTS